MTISSGYSTCTGIDDTIATRTVYFDPVITDVQMLSWSPGNRGRLVFSDIHFQTQLATSTFPGECQSGSLTPQGKLIAYQLFDQPTCMP